MHKKLWQQLAIVVLLATGVASLWSLLAGWGISAYESGSRVYHVSESIMVDTAGEAFVHTRDIPRYAVESSHRTLDGKPIEKPDTDRPFWIQAAYLPIPEQDRFTTPAHWSNRVQQVAMTRGSEATLWYLVHNGEQQTGKAYLVGYDALSKTNFVRGYIGLQGFSKELPPVDQWFSFDGRIAFTQTPDSGAETPFRLQIAASEGLFEINLSNQSIITRDAQAAYCSVAGCRMPLRVLSQDLMPKEVDPKNVDVDSLQGAGTNQQPDEYYEKLFIYSIAGRQEEKVLAFPTLEDSRFIVPAGPFEFTIPAKLRLKNMNVYFVSPEIAVLDVPRSLMPGHTSDLYWINPAGEMQRTETVQLNWKLGQDQNHTDAYFPALAIPSPLAMGVLFLGIAPLQPNFQHVDWADVGYLKRVGILFAEAWPPMLVLLFVSAALTWLALRWHRQYARPHTGAWAALIFLLGVPGFIAYWAYHRRPALEPCPECNKKVPRNRDACAECQQPFAEPKLLGTEVFV